MARAVGGGTKTPRRPGWQAVLTQGQKDRVRVYSMMEFAFANYQGGQDTEFLRSEALVRGLPP